MDYSAYFSADDCRKILKKYNPTLKLKCYTLQPFCEELRGYLGDHLLLVIETVSEDKITFFVKSTKTANLSECWKDAKYFDREVLVYNFFEKVKTALPHVEINSIPKFIHSNEHEILVLENLSENGYEGGAFQFTKTHLEKAIEALAKFHTVSIAYEEHMSSQLGRNYELTEECGEFPDPLFRRTKESSPYKSIKAAEFATLTLIDLCFKDDKIVADNFKDQFLKSITKVYKLLNEKNHYRKVISNGDLWGNNMVFKHDENGSPVDCKLVDFQFVRYVPPASDLTMLIYFTSNWKQYQQVHHFYNHYYNSLSEELKKLKLDINKILPLNEFKETCRLHAPIAKIIWLIYRQISQARYLSMEDVSKDMNLFKSVIMDKKRAWFVGENYRNDPQYREFIERLIHNVHDVVTKEVFPVEDCYKIVENTIGQDYKLSGYDVKPLSEKGGFLGEHSILEIRIKTKQEIRLTYFLKQPPSLKSQYEFVVDTGVLFKENRFYSRVIPELISKNITAITDVCAKCYYVDDNGLVLDDLQSQGLFSVDKRRSMGLKHVLLVLKALAKLHASGLIYEEVCGVKLNKIFKDEFLESFYTTSKSSIALLEAAKRGIETQIEIFPSDTAREGLYSKLCKLVDGFRVLTKPSDKYRNTICHGDLWANNILLNEGKVILVDFQSYRYCPPAHDVMQFIYLSTNRKFREEHLDEVLKYYHQELTTVIGEYGCRIIPYSDFLESCEFEKIMAVVQSVTHFHNILMSKERLNEFFGDADYCEKTLFTDRSDNIKRTCSTEPLYRERNHEAITDARNLCEELVRNNFDFDNIIRI